MGKLLITGVTAVTMNDTADIVKSADILIENGRIAGIGVSGSHTAAAGDIEMIDGRGKVVLPGLINAHTHAAMTLLRGYADDLPLTEWLEKKIWPREAFIREGDIYDGTMLAAAEMIKGGTTAFADMYFRAGEIAQAVLDSGLRASVCEVIIGVSPTAAEDLAGATEFVTAWSDRDALVTAMFGPHSLYTCGTEILKKIAVEAARLNTGVHIHLLETKTEREDILKMNGVEPFDVLKETGLLERPLLAAHSVYLTEKEADIAAANNYSAVHTPGSNLKLASGIAPIWDYLRKKVNAALGTDGAASNNNLDMFEEMRLAALVHKVNMFDATVVSAYEALSMATRGGARTLGLANEIGQLTPGYKADIILVDTDQPHLTPEHNVVANLVYSAGAADVTETIVDGKLLMRERTLLAMDEKAVMAKARATATDLVNRT